MREELFVSGRNIPNIDPYLNIWHWQIPLYLFLGGLAAGILFFAGFFVVRGKEEKMQATVKWAPIIAPIVLILGLDCIVLGFETQTLFLATVYYHSSGISNGMGSLDIDDYYAHYHLSGWPVI